MSTKRYKRRIFYAGGEKSQEFTENASSLSEALERELKFASNSAKKTPAMIVIEQE